MKLNRLTVLMRDILVCWNNPVAMQTMINWHATKNHGDSYAMVQRQKQIANVV